MLFSLMYLRGTFRWNYAASLGCIVASVDYALRS
jgi:uncharacterized protein (DUF486 family)